MSPLSHPLLAPSLSSPPGRGRGGLLSGSGLKAIAIAAMLIDHLAIYYFRFLPDFHKPLFSIGHHTVNLLVLMNSIGRLAFPIFAFLLVEGFLHTRNRKRYGINLLLFALISEIPWNLVHSHHWLYPGQNVLFTLLLGFLGLCALEHFSDNRRKQAASLIALLLLSLLLRADYGGTGYTFILFLYVLRKKRLLQAVIGSCMLGTWIAGFAFIPINMYNGRRGFIKGQYAKYLFYLIYPLHLAIIYLMQCSSLGSLGSS